MGQLGRYTTYVGGVATKAHTLLSKLFPNGPFSDNTQGAPLAKGDEKAAQAIVQAVATSDPGADPNGGGLLPKGGVQAGDLGMFPSGVDLSFGGAPDVSTVKWSRPGDPANGYIPDVTSPTAGPGHTEGTDKTGDPTDTIAQIQADATTSDPSRQNLRDPSADGPAIYKNNTIGSPQKLGDSGGNV